MPAPKRRGRPAKSESLEAPVKIPGREAGEALYFTRDDAAYIMGLCQHYSDALWKQGKYDEQLRAVNMITRLSKYVEALG